ncbi:MAG TPA: ATP-binding protein [Polyangiaceae bacterium]|jgi:PAS domain S-box-containing protein|nr:ATP-binding protein [Polyangiaceae bacterium]
MSVEGASEKQLEELLGVLADLSSALFSTDPDRRQIVVPARSGRADDGARAEARYRALVEQIPAITFTVSLEEGAPEIYVGPQIEQILGFTQDEWMSDPILWFNQCHPDDRDIWHQEFSRGIQKGGPFRAQCRVFAKDGRTVFLHGEAQLVRDDVGRPLFLQGVVFDITEQKLAEKKMKEAQEIRVLNERLNAVGQMAASIGHDLRNPIGAIRNAWTLVSKKVGTVPEVSADKRTTDLFGVIDRELGRCSTILSELLEFARDRPPHRVPTDLRALIDEVFSVVAKPAPTMQLVNEIPPDYPRLAIDVDQIRQVLVNLVQNALEAIGKTGTVRAAARVTEDGEHLIEIIDDGKGIAPELHDSIWKPLFTTKKRGTGLGLPIVVNIVGRHEGLVSFESAPGKGTTFRVQLPPRAPSEGPEPDAGGTVELPPAT